MVIKEALQGGPFLGPRMRHSRHVGFVRLRMGIWTCSILSHCFKYASSGNKADVSWHFACDLEPVQKSALSQCAE